MRDSRCSSRRHVVKNRYEIRGDVTVINVRGRSGSTFEVEIDTADLETVDSFTNTWYARWSESSGRYYIACWRDGKQTSLHRLILSAHPGQVVDHIDNNPFNNRRSNIRLATHSQNARNRVGVPRSSSKYKGVTFHRNTGKWQAQIRADGHYQYIGLFDDPASAARAYDDKAVELFGEFAKTNFPIEGQLV